MLLAGVKSFDMSPWQGVELAGYPHYPRHNTGVHDPLFASCLYLNSDGVELAFVTLDILFFSKKYVRRVRNEVFAKCGIEPGHVLICCSHTHSGPWASGKLDMEALITGNDAPDAEYVDFLTDGLVKLVCEAKRDAFEASLGVGAGVCGAEQGVGGNRRIKGGVSDPTVGVVAVRDKEGILRGLFMHYTLHPTFIHEDSTLVTADYPGCIRKLIFDKFPGVVFGFAQGASGDQSSRYFRVGQSYGEAERVAGELTKAALAAIEDMRFDAAPTLAISSAELPVELRTYGPIPELQSAAEAATREYNRLRAQGADYLSVQNANLKMLGAEDILGYATLIQQGADISLLRDENPAEVVAVKLGDACLGCVPGEVFVEYALRAKAESPFPLTLIVELCNGCLPGYCYTQQALEQGGYEVDTSMLTPAFGDRMTHLLVAQMKRVRGA